MYLLSKTEKFLHKYLKSWWLPVILKKKKDKGKVVSNIATPTQFLNCCMLNLQDQVTSLFQK